MAYPYYQHAGSGWGTAHHRFSPPPTLNFQPKSSWGAIDFFLAHVNGSESDLSVFTYAFNRIHGYAGDSFGPGVGMHEARVWHRRAYGGLAKINLLLPEEIGHAAAYEAYRTWIHNSHIYEPLCGDTEKQRDGLIGLAIAETTKSLQHTGHYLDLHGLTVASEAAAATASLIFSQSEDMEDSSYSDDFDPYVYDNERRSRRSRRHSSASRLMPGQLGSSTHGSNPIPIPGSSYGGSYPSSIGGYPGSYPVSASFPVGDMPYVSSYGGVPVPGGSLIVTTKPRSHRLSSRHRHHGRSSRCNSVIIPHSGPLSYYPDVPIDYGRPTKPVKGIQSLSTRPEYDSFY